MELGMLWYDNDPKTELAMKVIKAAKYYTEKYGTQPNMCFVHPSMVTSSSTKVGTVIICGHKAMLPNHFWIGVHKNGDSDIE
jgi:hypothetical protein